MLEIGDRRVPPGHLRQARAISLEARKTMNPHFPRGHCSRVLRRFQYLPFDRELLRLHALT